MKGIDLVQIKIKGKKLVALLSKYIVVLVVVISGLLASLVVESTGRAVTAESSEQLYLEEIATFKSAVFDEDTIAEVVQLSANDVSIRAKLPKDRDNPFLDF